MNEPIAMKNSSSTAMSLYLALPKRQTMRSSIYFMSPWLSRLLKTPPMTSRNAITAISIPPPEAPSTRIGDSSHFQKGSPPSTYLNSLSVSIIMSPFAFSTLAYSPPGTMKVSA